MKKWLGLDLGTDFFRAMDPESGEIVSVPAVIAFDNERGKPLAFGSAASFLSSRVPGAVTLKPLGRRIEDATPELLAGLISNVLHELSDRISRHTELLIAVSGEATNEKEALILRACEISGFHKTYLVDTMLASAFASGIPFQSDFVLVHSGASCTDVAVYSHGRQCAYRSCNIAGNQYSQAIAEYVQCRYGVVLSPENVKRLKETVASVSSVAMEDYEIFSGVRRLSGLPRDVRVTSEELKPVLEPTTDNIFDLILATLKEARFDPDHIVLTGGTAGLHGLGEVLSSLCGIPFVIPDDPAYCVINGIAILGGQR